jgi:hypothetical protein
MDAHSVREKQGLVPDLQIGDPHYELKGIRVDSSNANYSGGLRSTGYSTGRCRQERAQHRQVGDGEGGEAGP